MSNSMELKELLFEINRVVNRKLNKMITKTAVINNISVKVVESKYEDVINKAREKLLAEEMNIHKKEIEILEKPDTIKVKVKAKVIEPKPKVEPFEEVKLQPIKERKNKKSEFGFTTEELNVMIKEYFYNQIGYRRIAKMLEKDETKVRKQIAQLMSELVA